MNVYKTPQAAEVAGATLRRQSTQSQSQSTSTASSSSNLKLERSTSLLDSPPSAPKRRSNAAPSALDSSGSFREALGISNTRSQSTTAGKPVAPNANFTQRISTSNNLPLTNGALGHSTATPSSLSPASSPHRRARPRSPIPPSSVTAPPQIPSLPLLPATVYDPSTPNTASPNESPSTADLFTPNTYTPNTSTDYFNLKPRAPSSNSQRPASRSKADKVLGRSPLGSPPVAVVETEARYNSQSTAGRPTTANTRDTTQKPTISSRRERSHSRDHGSRDRSGSNASSRLDDGYQGTPPRTRERREKDKKTMLSRALQKANTAVLLDNAQNFEGAMEAYGDACKLLQQVMIRSTGEEDRRKLDAIRMTYTSRIEELQRLNPGHSASPGKSLPARPMSNESLDETRSMLNAAESDEPVIIGTATMTRIINDRPIDEPPASLPTLPQALPLRLAGNGGSRESVISTAIRDVQRSIPNSTQVLLQPPPGKLASTLPLGTPGLESPMDRSYMPPPLSPRRPLSPQPPPPSNKDGSGQSQTGLAPSIQQPAHRRANSSESTSWLDTIDESGGSSCSSSVHSFSPRGPRRKHLRNISGVTEAEFDAALDEAIEAAYDEGYEPFEDEQPNSADIIATRLRNVEMAKERVREAEREEAIAAAKFRYKETQLRNKSLPHVRESAEFNSRDEEEEEERMLDEMTREYMLDGFDFDLQTKSALPRQSDSSGFSGSTYNSSVSSHRNTAGTSLSTVAEVTHQKAPTHSPPPVPPPSGPLPSVSEFKTLELDDALQATPGAPTASKEASSVRSRRLSGQNAKALKIETALPPVPAAPHTEDLSLMKEISRPEPPPLPKSAAAATFSSAQPAIDPAFKIPALPQNHQSNNLATPSLQPPIPSPADTTFTVSPATPATSYAISTDSTLVPASPKNGKSSAMGIRKNKSSLSLKQRTLSISSPDGSDGSIGTPLSTTFSFTGRKQSNTAAPLPTPSVPTFNVDGLPSGGMHLFESDIHSPYSPGSPSATVANAPIPLEPCPDSYLLRPFWLMRCFYQTIAHPRGGYLSTKLFVPRDVWRVKGVKLKNIDDKIANCDLLTAALQKLSSVDTLDADAVLEEMQALEVVLDQVQTQLAKKLGNEVGVHGISTLFKDAYTVGNGAATGDGSEKGSHGSQDHAPKSAMSQSKSYLTSWRKLRSKGSAVGLSNMAGGKVGNEVPKDSLTMATLPMTSLPNIRFAKRDPTNVTFDGPNAGYMGSLARLFDTVQILDHIARQVEDPGLKHSSPTHVGLELSARHAAEFFGFYICRFVLSDLTMMLDKFIKRGSEWVLV